MDDLNLRDSQSWEGWEVFGWPSHGDSFEKSDGEKNGLRDFYEHKTAEVIDDRTVRVPIKFPAATFMVNLASDYMKMSPEHVAGPLTQEDVNCCPENMIGSGPFIFKDGSWQKQEAYEYVRNDDYFKAPRPTLTGSRSS
ncbi:hypothetical protein GBAR_LOCUS30999 [Geodia barretti]|uniref:Solute-binding protein family 5 domain-containing protein n=1 Tax=Geodia barretti TaxID=519541 RepID=A0AA35TZ30_GEOBA|nr:hypothetical protein GBAR_LOCUS30999 [Geodia barretti]